MESPTAVLKWCLHSYFVVEYRGHRLAVDPHDGDSLNLPRCKEAANYVLITHNHYDHNAVEMSLGSETKKVIRWSSGRWKLGPFIVKGVRLSHGNGYGYTHAYSIFLEGSGITITHLGDVGEPPSERALEILGRSDVVMVPAGDVTTVNQETAIEWAQRLGAKLIVPMHYWLPGSTVPLDPIDGLLSMWKGPIMEVPGSTLRLGPSWPPGTTLILFRHLTSSQGSP